MSSWRSCSTSPKTAWKPQIAARQPQAKLPTVWTPTPTEFFEYWYIFLILISIINNNPDAKNRKNLFHVHLPQHKIIPQDAINFPPNHQNHHQKAIPAHGKKISPRFQWISPERQKQKPTGTNPQTTITKIYLNQQSVSISAGSPGGGYQSQQIKQQWQSRTVRRKHQRAVTKKKNVTRRNDTQASLRLLQLSQPKTKTVFRITWSKGRQIFVQAGSRAVCWVYAACGAARRLFLSSLQAKENGKPWFSIPVPKPTIIRQHIQRNEYESKVQIARKKEDLVYWRLMAMTASTHSQSIFTYDRMNTWIKSNRLCFQYITGSQKSPPRSFYPVCPPIPINWFKFEL